MMSGSRQRRFNRREMRIFQIGIGMLKNDHIAAGGCRPEVQLLAAIRRGRRDATLRRKQVRSAPLRHRAMRPPR